MYTLDLFFRVSDNQRDDCIWVKNFDISEGLILNSDIHIAIRTFSDSHPLLKRGFIDYIGTKTRSIRDTERVKDVTRH